MGAAAIPLIATAIGTGVQAYQTQKVARQQDRALADQIQRQARTQSEADALVRNIVSETEQSRPQESAQDALSQYLDVARRTQGQALGSLGGVGGDRFSQDVADATAGLSEYTGRTADIFSRIDAPARQREAEARRFGRLGTDIGTLMDRSAGDRYLGDIRMRSIRRNPWLDALGQAAQGYGMSAASGGVGSTGSGMTEWGSFGPGSSAWRGLG